MTVPTLGYDRVGDGEPLLLLHGLGSTREDFAALTPDLAQHFTVLSMDLPGHGDSPMIDSRPSIEALTAAVLADLDVHGLERVHVLGNSLGGRVAIELARRGRTRSVVSVSPSGLGLPVGTRLPRHGDDSFSVHRPGPPTLHQRAGPHTVGPDRAARGSAGDALAGNGR